MRDDDTARSLTPAERLARQQARQVRERVIARLSEGFAQDLLDVDEFERRVSAAHTNEAPDAIEALVADLPPADDAHAVPAGAVATTALVKGRPDGEALAVADQVRLFAIMGGVDRRGDWTVPRKLKLTTVMGGAFLDLREARFPPGPVDIEIFAFMGGTQIIVPPGLAVQTDGSALMGGFQQVNRASSHPDPDAPLLRVHGFAIMGGVDVQMRLPGESEHEAQHRQRGTTREERKSLRAERHVQRRLERDREP
jgi:DUF1707 SHOCT-like domain/Cell wall-active antibiotics response LiaF, C-terminal